MALWPTFTGVTIAGYGGVGIKALRTLQQAEGDDPADAGNHSLDLSPSSPPPPFLSNSLTLIPMLEGNLNKPGARLILQAGASRSPELDRDFLYTVCGATVSAAYANIKLTNLKRQRQLRWAGYLSDLPAGYTQDTFEDGQGRDNLYDPAQEDYIVAGYKTEEIVFEADDIKMALMGIDLAGDPKEHILSVTSVAASVANGEPTRTRIDGLIKAYLDNATKYSAFMFFPLVGVNGTDLTADVSIEPLIDAGRTTNVTFTYIEGVLRGGPGSGDVVNDYFAFGTEQWDDLHWSQFALDNLNVTYGGTPSALPITALPTEWAPAMDS